MEEQSHQQQREASNDERLADGIHGNLQNAGSELRNRFKPPHEGVGSIVAAVAEPVAAPSHLKRGDRGRSEAMCGCSAPLRVSRDTRPGQFAAMPVAALEGERSSRFDSCLPLKLI